MFLSYSHDSEAHLAWVRQLAEQLRANGVDVILDQWDLRAGADVVRFMERGIVEADRVLMVCTANYVAKAEERKGGAGYEGMIVTGQVVSDIGTIKFVPIVRDNSSESLLPAFLGGRLWLNFRDDRRFNERLLELLHDLHEVPRFVKPPLGPSPFAAPPRSAPPASEPEPEPEPDLDPAAPASAPPPPAPASGPASGSVPAPTASESAGRPQPASPLPAQPSTIPSLSPVGVTTAQLRREGSQWRVERSALMVRGFEEELGEGVSLWLLEIPAGSFWMGSPAEELAGFDTEAPRHVVSLESFFLSQTPITQAQWCVVAQWKAREGESWGRELDPNPSRFQSRGGEGRARWLEGETNTEQRPVEQVSWYEAMEFCARLSQRTGRCYTLPSEAQWEYACRAGTTTPFHFGSTLTTELGNYDGTSTYANGPQGEYRKQTTPVGTFPANAWGLQDMHGNVWEWCLDQWHGSYEGAPTDGSAWLDGEGLNRGVSSEKARLLRGGSWYVYPGYCRSAFRLNGPPGLRSGTVGFRVCCLPQD